MSWTGGIHSDTGGPYDTAGNDENGNPVTPAPPTSIVVSVEPDGFFVSWTASTTGGNQLTYSIENGLGQFVENLDVTNYAFLYTNEFKYGKTFTFTVIAIIPGGNSSEYLSSQPFTFPEYLPSTPVFVSYSYTINSITLNYTPGNGDYSSPTYYIEEVTRGLNASPGSGELTYTFSELNDTNTSYTFLIYAVNTLGQSAEAASSGAIDVSTPQLPGPPTNVVATSINNGNTIQVTWNAPGSDGNSVITSYKVYDSADKTNLLGQTEDATASIDIPNTSPRRSTFECYVTAENGQGESAVSIVSNTLTILPAGLLPPSPKILPPVIGDLAITLNWTAVSPPAAPVTGYRVTRSDDVIFSLLIEGVDIKTWEITDGLVAGTPVTFTVASVNANGDSLVAASVTVTPITTPDPPAAFVAYVGKIPGTAVLYWTPPSPANGGTPLTGYVLTYNEIVINLGTVNTFMVYVKAGVGVQFSLVSKNKIGVSTPVDAETDGVYIDPTVIDPLILPDTPLNVVAYVGLPGTVYLYWLPQAPSNGGPPLTGHILTYNGITVNLPGTALKFFDNVVDGQGITFKLVSKNKNGLSEEVSVDILGGGDVTLP